MKNHQLARGGSVVSGALGAVFFVAGVWITFGHGVTLILFGLVFLALSALAYDSADEELRAEASAKKPASIFEEA